MIGVGQNRRLLRSGGSAFASFRCYVWIGVCFVVVDWRLGRSLIDVWFTDWRLDCSLSLSLRLFAECVCCVLFTECVSLFCTCYENRLKIKRLCKMISGSTSVNFGQMEIIFRKIYFP